MNIPTSSDRLDNGNVYLEAAPFQSNQERLVGMGLRIAAIPGDVIRQIRPPLPYINPFPARFGYPDYAQRQPGIRTALDLPYSYMNRRDDISGGPATIESSARNVSAAGNWW